MGELEVEHQKTQLTVYYYHQALKATAAMTTVFLIKHNKNISLIIRNLRMAAKRLSLKVVSKTEPLDETLTYLNTTKESFLLAAEEAEKLFLRSEDDNLQRENATEVIEVDNEKEEVNGETKAGEAHQEETERKEENEKVVTMQ